jgi:hypothetical protein
MLEALLAGDCEAGERDRVSHVVVQRGAPRQDFMPCGPVVYEDESFAVYAVGPRG